MQTRYQGVNWLDKSNWNCNDGENPFNWGAVDITSLQPMELMFVKVKHWALANGSPSMLEALQYDSWMQAADKVRARPCQPASQVTQHNCAFCHSVSCVCPQAVWQAYCWTSLPLNTK
jgi:hypothetical protein